MNKKKHFQLHSIQTSIILAYSLLILSILFTFSFFFYQYTIDQDKNTSLSYSRQLVDQMNSSIDNYIEQMENISSSLVDSRNCAALLENGGLSLSSAGRKAVNTLTTKMSIIASSRNDIVNIVLLGRKGQAVFGDSSDLLNPYADYRDMDWYRSALAGKGAFVISTSHVQNLVLNHYRWVVSISRAVTSKAGRWDGVLLIDLNYNIISNICKNIKFNARSYVFLIDDKGNMIYHPQQQLVYSDIKREYIDTALKASGSTVTVGTGSDQRYYVAMRSPVTGWTAVGVIYTEELVSRRNSILLFYLFITLIAIGVSTGCAIIISKGITRPIKQLEKTMREAETGDLSIQANIQTDNEIGQLAREFNMMLQRINQLVVQNISTQRQRRKSELKALQAQIKPHFLYNTLDTIIWLTESGKTEDAVSVTAALANLFRTSVSRADELIPLSMELSNVKSYLIIQQVRYRDKLTFSIDIPQEFLQSMVVKLMMQPIVENAVDHGIKPKQGPGKITITARQNSRRLIISVHDDGVGIPEETLRKIRCGKEISSKSSSGIGVSNVNRRLKLYFGNRYGLRFQSASGYGTTVYIILPALDQ